METTDLPLLIKADKVKLLDDVKKSIIKLSHRKDSDKKKTTIIITLVSVGSSITTVLIGLSSYFSDISVIFNITALVVSASVTVLSAWDKLFNHKRLWIMQAEALNAFKELDDDIKHLEATNSLSEEALNICYLRYKKIYSKWNSTWMDLRLTE
jgi:hypothetical protein